MKTNLLTSSSNQFRIRKFVIEGVACQPPARWHTCHALYYNFLNPKWMISNFHDFWTIKNSFTNLCWLPFSTYLLFLLQRNLISKIGKIQNSQFRNWLVDLVNKICVSFSSSKSPISPIMKINFFHENQFTYLFSFLIYCKCK